MAHLNSGAVIKRLEMILELREQKKAITIPLEQLVDAIGAGAYDAEVVVTDQELVADLRLSALKVSQQFYATRGGSQSPAMLTRGAQEFLDFLTGTGR